MAKSASSPRPIDTPKRRRALLPGSAYPGLRRTFANMVYIPLAPLPSGRSRTTRWELDASSSLHRRPRTPWSCRTGLYPRMCRPGHGTRPLDSFEWQEQGIAAFDKLFSVAPELLEVGKLLYLEASDKPKQWDGLVSMSQAKLDYFLPNPRRHVLRPPIPEQESKSDRGLIHPMLRYFILPWRDRSKLPPLIITPPKSSCGHGANWSRNSAHGRTKAYRKKSGKENKKSVCNINEQLL
ncbi:hypothetical protein B0H13DRAFT_2305642 [Mycena leptocephala]|nr:hypothetical protein B0H13DRAFT_2305642 [Mycena leptocephala]